MSVTKTITLTSARSSAGPYYEVSCSNDCITYGPCLTSGPLFLPTIGSSVNVDVYDTTQCIKLVNYNAECNNEVINSFAASGSTTTTTTTTIAPSYRYFNAYEYICTGTNPYSCAYTGNEVSIKILTTQIGTTNPLLVYIYSYPDAKIYKPFAEISAVTAPTIDYARTGSGCTPLCITTTTTSTTSTTTTTLSPNCVCYEVVVTSPAPPEGGIAASITYLPCDGGTNINRAFFTPGTYYQCARVVGGLPQIEFVDGTGTISPVGSCNTGTCPPATTTTTTTTAAPTTTTTTIAPTTTTTTITPTTTIAYDFYEADEYSCDPCTFQQSNVCVAFPAGTSIVTANRYYKPAFVTGFVYKNFTSVGSCGPALIMTTTGNSINCDTACGITTTTTTAAPTTTTTIPPTTTTTTGAQTLFYISNSSLDIIITDVKVNGVSLTGATGAGFPVYSGDSINAYSNQLGTHDVDIYYSNSTTGQHIEGYDSDLAFYCNAIVGLGSGTTQFGGAAIGAGTFQIYALDGTC